MIEFESTPAEKERAIQSILSRGLVKPKSMRVVLYEMLRDLGFRYLYWDMAQMFLVAAMLAGLMLLMPAVLPMLIPKDSPHTVIFACAPLLFLLILFMTEVFERAGSLYELKMTCKHTIQQITAFRVLCFTLPGIVFCVGLALNAAEDASGLLNRTSLALCGLFLCTSLSLICMRRVPGRWACAWVGGLWLLLAFVPVAFFSAEWEDFLSRLPAMIVLCAAVLSGLLFILETKKYLFMKGDVSYAFG